MKAQDDIGAQDDMGAQDDKLEADEDEHQVAKDKSHGTHNDADNSHLLGSNHTC